MIDIFHQMEYRSEYFPCFFLHVSGFHWDIPEEQMTNLSAQAERFANLVAVAPSPTAPKENALTRRGRCRSSHSCWLSLVSGI